MSGDLEFDRAAVGVGAKKDWDDGKKLAHISKAMDKLTPETAVVRLPHSDNVGTSDLLKSVSYFKTTMQDVVREFSDACGFWVLVRNR